MNEERWQEIASQGIAIERELRIEIERLLMRPHELQALREIVAYSRAIAQTFPDKGGDVFSAKLMAHAQIIEDMLERIGNEKGV